MRNQWKQGAAALAMIAAGCGAAHAATVYTFESVSNNVAAQVAAGEAQLSMSVMSNLAGTVDFTFTDAGATSMSIAQIYFSQDSSLLSGISAILNGVGVAFSTGGSPPNLPSAPSGFSADFRASADSPATSNGVNPGETLTLRMGLAGATTEADVIAALNDGSTLRVGMHVISIGATAGSEAFVNVPNMVIPLPGAAGLGFAGLALIGAARRRR